MDTQPTVVPHEPAPQRISLDPPSLRVLGALMEKEMTTPETYPLSLNSLIAAANQRSSREPVMDLAEEQVRAALYALEVASLVVPARGEGRVARFEHRIRTVLNLRRDETAVLCLLLLRGPQTPGELRSRADRLFSFDGLAQVQATLDRMGSREVPITAAMQRMPGSREVRFRHLLGNAEAESTATVATTHTQAATTRTQSGAPGQSGSATYGRPYSGPTSFEPSGSELAGLQQALQLLEERVRRLEESINPTAKELS